MNLQPHENVVPIVRTEVIDRFGEEFVGLVDSVSAELTTADLRELNERVELSGSSPARAAMEWLKLKRLIGYRSASGGG